LGAVVVSVGDQIAVRHPPGVARRVRPRHELEAQRIDDTVIQHARSTFDGGPELL